MKSKLKPGRPIIWPNLKEKTKNWSEEEKEKEIENLNRLVTMFLDGEATSNGFRFKILNDSKLNTTNHFLIQWSMKFNENYNVFDIIMKYTLTNKKLINRNR